MPGSMTDYFEKKLLDHIFRSVPLGLDITNLWVGLYTVSPSDSSGGTEVVGGGYTRVAVNRAGTGWDAAIGAVATVKNTGSITFPTASADWGTVVAAAILDAAAGGNQLYWGTLGTPKAVASGDTVVFNPASFTVTQD